ncbi:hypothetical protein CBL_01746 [Carabus blaptoides fortunei]
MSARQRFLTVRELEYELEKVCDELDSERADKIDVLCFLSDEEAINLMIMVIFTNGLNSAMVNAWKLHCLYRRHIENKSIMPQLDFHLYVTECLLIANQKPRSKAVAPSEVPPEVRNDKTDHFVKRSTEKRKRSRICHKHTFYKCS